MISTDSKFAVIKNLGYSNADAQLFTVPPYACALVVMYLLNYFSDRTQKRGPFLMFSFALGIIGWAMLLGVTHNLHARSETRSSTSSTC